MELRELQNIYFVGIGGIGMSALARYFRHLGREVSGYDKVETALTKQLVKEGAQVSYVDDVALLPSKIDLVIYTPAIPDTHQQLTYLREQGYPIKKRAEVLGIISKHKKTIGVAGTHGKTTTSSILTHLLRVGEINCTAFLGGIAGNINSNFVAGTSEWVVMEADEFDRSFLQLYPQIGVITSMDADHLDIYGVVEQLEESFEAFAGQVKETLYVANGLPLKMKDAARYSYGLEEGQVKATNFRAVAPQVYFDWEGFGEQWCDLEFTLAGQHNVWNATAAIAIAYQLGIREAAVREGLKTFKGIKRRFELVYEGETQVYIDDYAHHPTELEAAIKAARALYPNRHLTGVFQPHLYSRTQDFAAGFAAALDGLDRVLLLDIYPARELPIEGVDSSIIYKAMKNKEKVLLTKDNLLAHLETLETEILMTLGAGDIGTMVGEVAALLKNR
ncbi:MAG: UDP-N-acetylmuramate--L-alanine ligase [Aureispira sp.]